MIEAASGVGDRADGLGTALGRARTCLDGVWPETSRYPAGLASLRERLAQERLQVAVLGQFKRGKSTFLNALLGDPVLPTGVVPLTSIATFIRFAAVPSMRVSFLDGRAPKEPSCSLGDPAGAARALRHRRGNPQNHLRVARVDVGYPAAILSHGIVLIDTPGIASTLRHQTDAAIEVLRECDAGFFVLSVDPPVTEAELAYLDRVRPQVSRLFFVLNKIDYLVEDEKRAAADFLRRTLRHHLVAQSEIPIFELSARQGLAAKQRGDDDGVGRSGLAGIERHLVEFLAHDKIGALRQAVATKAAALLDAAGMDLALRIRALELPVEDLKQRAGQFGDALRDIERQRLVARDLLAGDRRRAIERLEGEADDLRQQALPALIEVLDQTFAAERRPEDAEAAAKAAIASAIPDFFEAKLAKVSGEFAREIDGMLARHAQQAEALIGKVRETAAALFEIPSIAFAAPDTFVIAREPYWVTQKWRETLNPMADGVLDRFLPTASRTARSRARLASEIDELVQRNVENLRWATLQNLDRAFRRFEGWFDDRLADGIDATRGAIEAALTQRRHYADRARNELMQLHQASRSLSAVRQEVATALPMDHA